MRLKWTKSAVSDLAEIYDYIERERPASAVQVAAEVLEQVESLISMPLRGRPGYIEGTRELIISRYPYKILYRVHDVEVQLLRVLHDHRAWPSE
jgi:toxin ParE1/3/4